MPAVIDMLADLSNALLLLAVPGNAAVYDAAVKLKNWS